MGKRGRGSLAIATDFCYLIVGMPGAIPVIAIPNRSERQLYLGHLFDQTLEMTLTHVRSHI